MLHLRAVVSPEATATEPPRQGKAPEDRGHVAAAGHLFYSCRLCQRELRQKHCLLLDALTIKSFFVSQPET